jgi:hypothetical protein
MPEDQSAREDGDEPLNPAILVEAVALLRRVPSQSRLQLVQAALTFVGTPWGVGTQVVSPLGTSSPPAALTDGGLPVSESLPRRVTIWMGQNGLDLASLEGVFHIGPSGVEVIAHTVPGKSDRERVRGCYLLAGMKGFLATGEPRFSDDAARAICRDLGCYDKANHSTYVRALGNLVVGSKSSSYELTQPGLKTAAEILREVRGIER